MINSGNLKFPLKVIFSDLGWEKFGQKERYPVKNRTGIALGICKGKFYRGHFRVKWDGSKSYGYYPASYLITLTGEELTIKQ